MSVNVSAEREAPVVSIVIVTYNAPEYVRQCLESVRARTHVPYEIVVVDNASEAPTRAYLQAQADLRLILNDDNRLWCAGCNQGMRAASPEARHFLLMNSDVEVLRDDWLDVMLAAMDRPTRWGPVALVGTRHHYKPLKPLYGWLDGQCLLVRRELIEQVGYLDEERYPWAGAPQLLAAQALAGGYVYKAIHKRDRLVRHHRKRSRDGRKELPVPRKCLAEFAAEAGLETQPVSPLVKALLGGRRLRRWRDLGKFYYCPPSGPPRTGVGREPREAGRAYSPSA